MRKEVMIKLHRLGIKVTLRIRTISPQKWENVLNSFHSKVFVCPTCRTVTWSDCGAGSSVFLALDIGSKPRGAVLVI